MGFDTPGITAVRGSTIPQLRRQDLDFKPLSGYEGQYRYEGADQAEMVLLYQSWIAAGCSCRLTLENDKAMLEVQDSTQQWVIDSWEIVGNNEERNLFTHPLVVALNTYFNAAEPDFAMPLGDLAATLQNGISNKTSETDLFDVDVTDLLYRYKGTAVEDFYARVLLGNTSYRAAQYVLRHKTNVSNRSGVNVSDFGVNQLYSPAQFLAEVSDSGLWIFPLPSRLQYKLAAIPSQPYPTTLIPNPTTPPGFLWSWLKDASTETTSANNRVEITTEYSLDLWYIEEYGLYNGTSTPQW